MLTLENITKSFGEKDLFNHLHTIIRKDDRIGLIGVNGTGKSTLLKVIAGLEPADEGELIHPKDFTIAYLPQEQVFEESTAVIDYIFAGDLPLMKLVRDYEKLQAELEADPANEKLLEKFIKLQQEMDKEEAWDANAAAKTILSKMGVTYYDADIQTLSGGQKKRVALARALIQPAHLLILDEPTNHLDNETIVWLEEYLSQYKGAILLVTHDRYFLNRVTNRIYELAHGNLYEYEGNYEYYMEQRLIREEEERQAEQKHANRLRNEMAWLKRGARARSTKQRARIERIAEMQDKTFHTKKESVEIQVGSSRLGKDVLELENVSKSFNDKPIWQHVNLLIKPHDRIGLIGPNGAGKSTLLDVIAGRLPHDSGKMTIGETVKFGYYKQGEEELDPNIRLIEYIKKTADIITTVDGTVITAEQMLERFLFPRPKQWAYIKSLSGGERRRLYLLKILMEEPNVLLLDEPTNDLDIETLSILEEYIDHFPGVVLTVSHDRYFLDRVVDNLLVFDGKGQIDYFYGNYSDFMAKKAATAAQTPKKAAQTKDVKPKRKKLSYMEQKEWDSIEDEIEVIEAKVAELEEAIASSGDDYEAVQKLYAEQQEAEAELEVKMERWEELSLKIESLEQ